MSIYTTQNASNEVCVPKDLSIFQTNNISDER